MRPFGIKNLPCMSAYVTVGWLVTNATIRAGQISCIISMLIKHKSAPPSGDLCIGRVVTPIDDLLARCENGLRM